MDPHEKNHLRALQRIFEDAFKQSADNLTIARVKRLSADRNYMREIIITMPIDVVHEVFTERPKALYLDLIVPLYESMNESYLSALHVTAKSVYEFVNKHNKDGYQTLDD